MSRTFCTITTISHLPKVYALYASLKAKVEDTTLQVLVTDGKVNVEVNTKFEKIEYFDTTVFENNDIAQKLIKKYRNHADKVRWGLKPVFLSWLLNQKYDKVIYVDNDIYFVDNFNFLFRELDNNNIILTPHWRPDNPGEEPLWFETNFRDGIFNAGFFGANKNAIKALEWWANACLYKCEKNYRHGLFDDQKYLDMMPVIEKKTGIIYHQGCNMAYWNIKQVKRKPASGDVILSDGNKPVFIHFADCTVAAILRNEDPLLRPFLNEYLSHLKHFGFNLNLTLIMRRERFWARYRYLKWQVFGDLLF